MCGCANVGPWEACFHTAGKPRCSWEERAHVNCVGVICRASQLSEQICNLTSSLLGPSYEKMVKVMEKEDTRSALEVKFFRLTSTEV